MKMNPLFTVFFGLTLITGIVYPALITGVAVFAFPKASTGSLIVNNAVVIGSELIGQDFKAPDLFWGRPSGTSPFPYNSGASSGTNIAPSNPALLKRVTEETTRIIESHEGRSPVPVDFVTTSASGLDPHISIAAAIYQVERVAKARGMEVRKVRELVDKFVEPPTLGILGEGRVNVLLLNLALIKEGKK